jgi:hypothetical protein
MVMEYVGTASTPSRAARPRRRSRAVASRVARSGSERVSVSIAVCGAWLVLR